MSDAIATVYLETTVVSYLTARTPRDPVTAGQIAATHAWWNDWRQRFDIVTSELVVAEASAGDATMAAARLAVLATVRRLPVPDEARALAELLVRRSALPERARVDALHVAIAAFHAVPYLLTWNCRHLANAILQPKIEQVCRDAGWEAPRICTPPELTEVLP